MNCAKEDLMRSLAIRARLSPLLCRHHISSFSVSTRDGKTTVVVGLCGDCDEGLLAGEVDRLCEEPVRTVCFDEGTITTLALDTTE